MYISIRSLSRIVQTKNNNIQQQNRSQLTDTGVTGIKMSSERNTERVRRNISMNFEILSRAKWFNGERKCVSFIHERPEEQNGCNLWKRKIN